MKNIKLVLVALFALGFSLAHAQVEQVDLNQTTGKFTTESLTLAAGSYQFNIGNSDVDHEVGFVLVPKGKYEAEHHIKEAYVTKTVATGSASLTSIVHLEAGDYEYFCPLNPTPKYSLTVVDDVETIKLGQVTGDFDIKGLTVTEGSYQFEIANTEVDHEVGFVLVPKGTSGPENHIKPAYVKAPVAQGSTSLTGIVNLKEGTYEYFCPLNPTPRYTLTVTK